MSPPVGAIRFPNAIVCKPVTGFDRSLIPTRSKKEINAAKDALKANEANRSSTANSIVSANKWENYTTQFGKACHKFVENLNPTFLRNSVFATENGAIRRGYSSNSEQPSRLKDSEAFLSWFLYYSPYGEFILNRDDYEFCRDYGFIYEPLIPHPMFMNMLIISRHFYEINIETLKKFTEVTTRAKNPIDPTLAYSMLFCSVTSAYSWSSYENRLFQSYGGHRASSAYDVPSLLNMYNGNPGKNMETAMQTVMADQRSVYGAKTLFHADEEVSNPFESWAEGDKEFKAFLKTKREEDNANDLMVYKPPNPFERPNPYRRAEAKPVGGQFLFKELIDGGVLDYLNERIRKEYANG